MRDLILVPVALIVSAAPAGPSIHPNIGSVESESSNYTNSTVVQDSEASGGAYLDMGVGGTVDWEVSAASGASYYLDIVYSATSDVDADISVDAVLTETVTLVDSSGAWTTTTVVLPLDPGFSTVTMLVSDECRSDRAVYQEACGGCEFKIAVAKPFFGLISKEIDQFADFLNGPDFRFDSPGADSGNAYGLQLPGGRGVLPQFGAPIWRLTNIRHERQNGRCIIASGGACIEDLGCGYWFSADIQVVGPASPVSGSFTFHSPALGDCVATDGAPGGQDSCFFVATMGGACGGTGWNTAWGRIHRHFTTSLSDSTPVARFTCEACD